MTEPALSMPVSGGQAPAVPCPGASSGLATPPALLAWLVENRRDIVDEWVERLSVLSPHYRLRPRPELYHTVPSAFDANLAALSRGDMAPMEEFIDFITAKRLQTGFPLSDVQKAFELFRTIVLGRLKEPPWLPLLSLSLEPVNAVLSYTIHRFSDLFQHMHERTIRQHAQLLEEQVARRTAQLAESERRYKTLVNEIHDGYFIIQEGIIIFANQAFCRMHGAELEEVLGQPFLRFVAPLHRPMMEHAYQETVDGNQAKVPVEYERLGCAPERTATEIRARVVDLGQGPVTIGICRDISARMAMEAKVREHERLAYVGHLTASLSHEIRNPLSAIKMNMQILARRLDLDGYDLRRLQITVREITRLEEILCQLLDTARPLTLQPEPVEVPALVRGCLELLEPKLNERGLMVRQSHPPGLPLLALDSARMEQALINLLLNAIEASPQGSEIRVMSRLESSDGQPFMELSVADRGAGVDARHLPHLFTPFFTSKARGTGLGLYNVKRIVEAHGGQVLVSESEAGGAVFSLRLPCPL